VEFNDGSTLAQMGSPDMRTPIGCALSWPQRIKTPAQPLDWQKIKSLDFEAPDHDRFPSIELARQALRWGGVASAAMNAANEIAVQDFLMEKIQFGSIFKVVEDTLEAICAQHTQVPQSLAELLSIDEEARRHAQAVSAAHAQ
jgi:1-deoxy-D-xylulose-5-phosphate reductoisomerase